MNKKALNKSQRKFVAREKSRIRRQFLDLEKQTEEIEKIKGRFLKQTIVLNTENQETTAEKPAKPVSVKSKPAKMAKKVKAPTKPKVKKSVK